MKKIKTKNKISPKNFSRDAVYTQKPLLMGDWKKQNKKLKETIKIKKLRI